MRVKNLGIILAILALSFGLFGFSDHHGDNRECADGYTPVNDLCLSILVNATPSVTFGDTDCHAVDFNALWGVPKTAKMVELIIIPELVSGSTAGSAQIIGAFYSDPACTQFLPPNQNTGYGFMIAYSGDTSGGNAVASQYQKATLMLNGQTTVYWKNNPLTPFFGCTGCTFGETITGPLYYVNGRE